MLVCLLIVIIGNFLRVVTQTNLLIMIAALELVKFMQELQGDALPEILNVVMLVFRTNRVVLLIISTPVVFLLTNVCRVKQHVLTVKIKQLVEPTQQQVAIIGAVPLAVQLATLPAVMALVQMIKYRFGAVLVLPMIVLIPVRQMISLAAGMNVLMAGQPNVMTALPNKPAAKTIPTLVWSGRMRAV